MIIVSNLFVPREGIDDEEKANVKAEIMEKQVEDNEKEEKPFNEQLEEEADNDVENTEKLIKKTEAKPAESDTPEEST